MMCAVNCSILSHKIVFVADGLWNQVIERWYSVCDVKSMCSIEKLNDKIEYRITLIIHHVRL